MTNTKIEQIRQYLEYLATQPISVISTDPKPIGQDGDKLFEMDTGLSYYWYDNTWNLDISGGGGGGGQGPPGPRGLSAYEVYVANVPAGVTPLTEVAWLESLKGEEGANGKSAYELYVEITSDDPVKTEQEWLESLEGKSAYEYAVEEGFEGDETAWLASLKGADGDDGKSAYEYAEDEGYTGTEQEFAEALADVENKVDKSKIVTTWDSPKNDEVPSAKLVHESLNSGGGGGEDMTYRKGVVVIGSATEVSMGVADGSWEQITADNEVWSSFWNGMHALSLTARFLKGEFVVPPEIYFGENDDGRFAIPCGVAKIEGAGEDTVIKVGYPAGGTAFLSATKHDGLDSAPCHISNLKIVNTGTTTFGVVIEVEDSSGSVIENVIVESMIGVGIIAAWNVKNVTFRNCTTINCGSAFAGEQAAGIAVTETNSNVPSNIVIDSCTVIGGAYAGIGIVNAEDCKVVNCHVHDYGQVGIGIIGGKRNLLANNTSIFNDGTQGEASPASQEFGILLSETEQCVVHGNNLPGSFLYEDNVTDCVVIDNIADNITPPNWEDKDNKLTAWGASPTDEQYPSAKLVKTALDGINVSGKEDKSNKITRLYDGVTDTQYASAKAVYDEFQILKRAQVLESWEMFSDVIKENKASDFVTAGDRLVGYWEDNGVYVPVTWEVLGIDQDEAVDESILHTVTLGTVDCLFSAMFDNPETNNPDSNRKNYGNNNWELSNIRQYLNSEDAPFVFSPTHDYDTAPTGYPTNGFLARLHPTMKEVIVPVKKWVSLANVDVEGGVSDKQLEETIFLLSQVEVDGGTGSVGTVTNEFVYQRYTSGSRIKYHVATAREWWLRSPGVGYSSSVRCVDTTGVMTSRNAGTSYCRVAPACAIG